VKIFLSSYKPTQAEILRKFHRPVPVVSTGVPTVQCCASPQALPGCRTGAPEDPHIHKYRGPKKVEKRVDFFSFTAQRVSSARQGGLCVPTAPTCQLRSPPGTVLGLKGSLRSRWCFVYLRNPQRSREGAVTSSKTARRDYGSRRPEPLISYT
jgi:hypothetical protein